MSQPAMPEAGRVSIGIFGGTGLYEVEGLQDVSEISLDTPFGRPSDPFVVGTLEGKRVAFLSRHGRGHRLLPAEVNYRANIYALKALGATRLISVNSVGSLREDFRPRDIVLADQFFDRTRRQATFFGEGLVAHVGMGHPVCPVLSRVLFEAARGLGARVHERGTYLCMEGPAFSTKAESLAYRSWGCDIIGMTAATEAKLAREAELCYATLCLVTDYDVWREEGEHVSVELVIENLHLNIGRAKSVIKAAVAALGAQADGGCGCGEALRNAIVTRPDLIPEAARKKLGLLVGKYLGT
jgi:5'-methylthioadenosine phosphorylase